MYLGSFIVIVFPSDIKISITNGCLSNVTGSACSIATQKNITVSITATINAGTSFQITIYQVTNSGTTGTSAEFSIYTYYDGYDSLIDKLSTSLTTNFFNLKITNMNISITPQSNVTY